MNDNFDSIWLAGAFVMAAGLSALGTGLIRRYALRKLLLAIPNDRSSHDSPTPYGGGLAIALVVLVGLTILTLVGQLPLAHLAAIGGAGAAVALVGWWDDRSEIKPLRRLCLHTLAAGWGLIWLGGLPALPMLGGVVDLGLVGDALALIYLVWMLNLFNFMDGINGIAGGEAVSIGVGFVIIAWITGAPLSMLGISGLIVAASLGFLPWNFPGGRIFMGDAGSGFLGLMLGLMTIHAGHIEPTFFWAGIVLSAVFWVDATCTLAVRAGRRQRLHEAHRTHAYQHAARRHGHTRVTLAVLAINGMVLLPVAVTVSIRVIPADVAVVGVAVALAAVAIYWNAGRPEEIHLSQA